jgi:hypothetical protein
MPPGRPYPPRTEPAGIVGGYEILREIGHGGMATVYLARQLELDRLTALKELGGLNATDPTFARRFVREAHMAGSLSHPNVVTVYDYIASGDTPYIAMEYLARGSLRPYVGKLSLAQLGGTLEGLLAGLARAHASGIVHRDLKPENLLVADDGRLKIADFGIATAQDELRFATRITVTGTTLGTPAYMAPEQAMGKAVGPAADLYSVGMITLELAAGRLPFDDAESQIAVMMRQIKQPTPPARKLNPNVDPGVSDWIEHMLVKDPARRTPSATEAWDEFEELLIARLGARWRRHASLLDPPGAGVQAPAAATPSTVPIGDTELGFAPTVPPTPLAFAPTVLPTAAAGVARAARGGGRPFHQRLTRALRIVVALALAAGVVLAALGGGAGSPNRTSGAPAQDDASPSVPAAATAAPQTGAPAAATAAPQTAAPAATAAPAVSATPAAPAPKAAQTPAADSGVGDSRSDDPSDDAPDDGEP